jgi:N utilization substance protein A
MFRRTLHMDERLAQALVAAEIVTLEELAYVPMDELLAVRGASEDELQLFRKRAREHLLRDVMGRAPGDQDHA